MATVYTALRHLYHLVPAPIRKLPLMDRLSSQVAQRIVPHDQMYTESYYSEDIEGWAVRSAPVIAQSIIDRFKPQSVIDVGCGTGAFLQVMRDNGCSCLGLEYSEAGLRMCRDRGLEVRKFDIKRETLEEHPEPFDVAISMEVAEHLPKRFADRFVDLLADLSETIVFTAATPGQEGVGHLNEQPHWYWINKFKGRGYRYEEVLSEDWRRQWEKENVAFFYQKNLMIFCRLHSKF